MATLTDEQIDLLYLSQKVVDARRAFTKRLAEGLRTNDQALIDEGNALKAEYEKIFGTAGLARSRVKGHRRSPWPPASRIPMASFISDMTSDILTASLISAK